MEIQIYNEAGITIINLTGEIDVSQAPKLRQTLIKLFEEGTKNLLINMRKVIYIDSAGLSVLISAHRRANEAGGEFALCNLQQPVRQVCRITGIDKVIQIFQTKVEATAKFKHT